MAAPILNTNDLKLQAAGYRFTNTAVSITGTSGAFRTPKNGALTTPASITLTATPNRVFTAVALYTWSYALSTQPNNWTVITTGTSINITRSSFLTALGTDATGIQYRCVVTENLLPSASGFFTITYSREASDPIIVDITRSTAVIPCTSAGVPTGFTNTDTVISVSRGGTALSYSATAGTPDSFTVSIVPDNVARTIGTISTTATTYGISGITAIAVDIATVVFEVTVYDASGTAVSPVFGKKITYNKITNGLVGGDATYYYIEASSPVISKSTSGAASAGTHTNITLTGKKIVGTALPVNSGVITVTGNGDTEAAVTTATNPFTTNINNSAGKTSYTVKLYSTNVTATAQLLATLVVPVVFTGSSSITAALTNDSATIPTNNAGTAGIYTGTSTEIHVYEGTTELQYDGVGTTAGTWKIATPPFQSSITVGSITDSGLYASIGNASNIVADTAYITYRITGKNAAEQTFLLDKTQTFSRSKSGTAGDNVLPNVNYDFAGATLPGAFSFPGTKVSSDSGTTTTITNTVQDQNLRTGTINLNPLDSYLITMRIKHIAGAWEGTVYPSNAGHGESGSYYKTIPQPVLGEWTTITLDMRTLDAGSTDYMTGGNVTGLRFDFINAVEASVAIDYITVGKFGVPTTGISGTKSITINAFKWGTAIGTFDQAATYTWGIGISATPPATGTGYPTGWTSSAPASTASGQTLYQLSLTITALATDTTTAVNWSNAVTNTIGFRQDGSTGAQGNSARVAYVVNTSATPPATPTAGTGDVAPYTPVAPPGTNIPWSFTPTATLTAGQFMYQSDGILTTGGNIAWRTPYLANLKVGSLSALSADLGTVAISTSGSLATTGKTYDSLTNGIFLGYSSNAYKFEIGPAGDVAGGNGIKWDGTNLTINGNGKFTGDITGASGKFTGSLDVSSNLTGPSTAVSAGQVYTVSTVGTSTAAQWKALFNGLAVGVVPTQGQQITATTTGTLTNGSTVTIAATGARLKISGDQILVYDANNVLRVVLGRVS
jgi:hypothetical protein